MRHVWNRVSELLRGLGRKALALFVCDCGGSLFHCKNLARKPVVAVPSRSPWQQQDQRNLAAFLASPSGRRFLANCRGLEYRNALEGCNPSHNHAYTAGLTAGCRDMLTYIVGELAVNFERPEQAEPQINLAAENPEEWLARMTP